MKKALKVLAVIVVVLTAFVMYANKASSTVQVERTFNAPVEKVWFIWNDIESIKKWWSPNGYSSPDAKVDLRVGGKFMFGMKSPNGDVTWNSGEYKEIIPHKKIVASFYFSDEEGKLIPGSQVKVPGSWPDEILLTVEFQDLNGKTLVKIEEVGIPLIMKILAKLGWEQQFDKFEKLL